MKKGFLIWVLSTFLIACSETPPEEGIGSLPAGTIAVVQNDGRVFESELTYSEGAFTKWEFKEYQVFRKYYRGLFNVAGGNNKSEFWYDFDVELLDALFPIATGNEVTVKGKFFSDTADGVEFWTHISVRAAEKALIKKGLEDVYVIDITTDIATPDRPIRWVNTIWYSPKYGRYLKMKIVENGKEFITKILDIQEPSNTMQRRRRGLGTVLI